MLTRDVRNALRTRGQDPTLPEMRRVRLLEMADAMDMFCQGTDGEMFDRDGTPWPEADITLVDLATYAREGYNAQLSIAYISLISTVNNIAERDQYLGRPIINVTDEGHIITKNPLLAPYVVKITKMWRKLGAWFWLATQNIDDLPRAAEPMLNMIEWWICLSMPPDEVEKIARFRELAGAEGADAFGTQGSGQVHRGRHPPRAWRCCSAPCRRACILALAQTEPEEKAERYQLMQQHGVSELMPPSRWPRRSTGHAASSRRPWPALNLPCTGERHGTETLIHSDAGPGVPPSALAARWPWALGAVLVALLLIWLVSRSPGESTPQTSAPVSETQVAGPPRQMGNPAGRFTLTLYADLECPFCRSYFPSSSVGWPAMRTWPAMAPPAVGRA